MRGFLSTFEHDPGRTHAGMKGKTCIAVLEIAVRKAEAARDFKAQHGKVRVLMVDGRPGPNAEVSKCT